MKGVRSQRPLAGAEGGKEGGKGNTRVGNGLQEKRKSGTAQTNKWRNRTKRCAEKKEGVEATIPQPEFFGKGPS